MVASLKQYVGMKYAPIEFNRKVDFNDLLCDSIVRNMLINHFMNYILITIHWLTLTLTHLIDMNGKGPIQLNGTS